MCSSHVSQDMTNTLVKTWLISNLSGSDVFICPHKPLPSAACVFLKEGSSGLQQQNNWQRESENIKGNRQETTVALAERNNKEHQWDCKFGRKGKYISYKASRPVMFLKL